MATLYILLNSAVLFLYWLMIATVTIRILLKRRPVTSVLTWLLIIYIIPLVDVIAYLAFGELHLGKRQVIKAMNMWPSVEIWLEKLKQSKHIFCKSNSRVAEPLFELCEKRQGIEGIKGNKIQLLTNYQDALNTIIRDINSAYYNIEMVFYIWQDGGLVDEVTEALINAAKRGVKCGIMIDSAGSWSFFHSHQPKKCLKPE